MKQPYFWNTFLFHCYSTKCIKKVAKTTIPKNVLFINCLRYSVDNYTKLLYKVCSDCFQKWKSFKSEILFSEQPAVKERHSRAWQSWAGPSPQGFIVFVLQKHTAYKTMKYEGVYVTLFCVKKTFDFSRILCSHTHIQGSKCKICWLWLPKG